MVGCPGPSDSAWPLSGNVCAASRPIGAVTGGVTSTAPDAGAAPCSSGFRSSRNCAKRFLHCQRSASVRGHWRSRCPHEQCARSRGRRPCTLYDTAGREHLRRFQTMHPKGMRHSAQPSVPCSDVNHGLRKGCTCAGTLLPSSAQGALRCAAGTRHRSDPHPNG
jgi:hypothetical protein